MNPDNQVGLLLAALIALSLWAATELSHDMTRADEPRTVDMSPNMPPLANDERTGD